MPGRWGGDLVVAAEHVCRMASSMGTLQCGLTRTGPSCHEQDEFAEICGFARSYMFRIETGGANPSLDAVEILATALKVPVRDLFLESAPMRSRQSTGGVSAREAFDREAMTAPGWLQSSAAVVPSGGLEPQRSLIATAPTGR